MADDCLVKIATLRDVWSKTPGRQRASGPESGGSDIEQVRLTAEDEALRLLIHRRSEVADRLDAVLFGDPARREAYEALRAAGNVMEAGDQLGEPAAGLLRRLAVDEELAETDDVLALVHRRAGERAMDTLRRRVRDSDDPARRREYNTAQTWIKQQTDLLAERDTRREAMDRMLPWLVEHRLQADKYPEPSR